MDLNGKTIIVTGGGQGLGRAMAVELAGAGANLALVDLNEDPLNEAVQLVAGAGQLHGIDACRHIHDLAAEDIGGALDLISLLTHCSNLNQ
mgnify:CR=1 FL=1